MMRDYSKEKLYNAITFFKENTKNCNKTKLFKLLYFLDMLHFKETGSSVTGLDYFAWEKGPFPCELNNKMSDTSNDFYENFSVKWENNVPYQTCVITPLKKFDDTYFSKREMRLLKEVAEAFKNDTATNMVDLTHRVGEPWQITKETKGENSLIDYFLVLNENSDITREDIIESENDKRILSEIFS